MMTGPDLVLHNQLYDLKSAPRMFGKVKKKIWNWKPIFYMSRSLEKWEECLAPSHHQGEHLRKEVLPKIVDQMVEQGTLTVSDGDSLLSMLKSKDRENWLLVISILKQKSKKKNHVYRK